MYVFGDNDARVGMGGQAAEMRGEPNTVGIRTKKAPLTAESVYYTDDEYKENVRKISEDFQAIEYHLQSGGLVVYPTDGVGTGFAELETRAPRTLQFIKQRVKALKTKYKFTLTFESEDGVNSG